MRPTQQVGPAPYTLVVSGVSGLDLAANDLRLTSTRGGPGDELYDVNIENRRGDLAEDISLDSSFLMIQNLH